MTWWTIACGLPGSHDISLPTGASALSELALGRSSNPSTSRSVAEVPHSNEFRCFRPRGLQRLLADIDAGLVEQIVVYKFDG